MSQMNFGGNVNHVLPGSPVSASNTGRPTRQLEQRTNELLAELNATSAGQLLVYADQTVDPSLREGQPVFWNAATQQFEAALASVVNDPASGAFIQTPSTDCLGVVLSKSQPNLATIATAGMARFTQDQLANAIVGPLTPGRYYLSAKAAGTIELQKPDVSVAILYLLGPVTDCETDQWVFIMPQTKDFLSSHIHYRFLLKCHAAGTVTTTDGRVEIMDADPTTEGWLPADDESFGGRAPMGAKFGYNLAAHTQLQRVWPPMPLEASAILWDKGHAHTGATEVNSNGLDPLRLVTINLYGIWWMSDCVGDVPWQTGVLDPDYSSLSSMSSVGSQQVGSDCPRNELMRVIVCFAKTVYANDKTVVTSLVGDTGQPIEFVNCDEEVASTGDLPARLNVQAMLASQEYYGGQVLKQIVNSQLLFGAGWVTEGLIAGSDNVILSSSHTRRLTPNDNTTPVVYQGVVTVNVDLSPGEKELDPQITKLGDTIEREYSGVLYLAFPSGRDSGLRMRFNVPTVGLPAGPQMKLRLRLFGRGMVGPFSALTMAYQRLADPTTDTPTPIIAGDTAVTLDVVTPSGSLAADNIILVESDTFTVAAGDTIFVELMRAADAAPAFNAEIGVTRVGGVLVAGE